MTSINPSNKKSAFAIFMIIVIIINIFAFVFATKSHGLVLTTDSAAYLSVAENLKEGRGLLRFDGTPLTLQPPAYPYLLFLISKISRFGIKEIALAVNLITYLLTLFLAGLFLHRNNHLPLFLCLLGVSLLSFYSPLFILFASMLTEGIFLFLGVLFFYLINNINGKRSSVYLILTALIAALLCLIRYAGIIYVFTGMLYIFLALDRKQWQKLIVSIC